MDLKLDYFANFLMNLDANMAIPMLILIWQSKSSLPSVLCRSLAKQSNQPQI